MLFVIILYIRPEFLEMYPRIDMSYRACRNAANHLRRIMLKVCICDDRIEQLETVQKLTDEYIKINHIEAETESFLHPDKLLPALETKQFHLYLLVIGFISLPYESLFSSQLDFHSFGKRQNGNGSQSILLSITFSL